MSTHHRSNVPTMSEAAPPPEAPMAEGAAGAGSADEPSFSISVKHGKVGYDLEVKGSLTVGGLKEMLEV